MRHQARATVKGNRIELRRQRLGFRCHQDCGGEHHAIGALHDMGKGVVKRSVFGVPVVEVHLEDDALRRVVDQAAQLEGIIEARPWPGPVGRNIVDRDKRELVAWRRGIGVQRQPPIEEWFLEGIERAGKLGQKRESPPEQRQSRCQRDAPVSRSTGRFGLGRRCRRNFGPLASGRLAFGKFVHGGKGSYAKRRRRTQ